MRWGWVRRITLGALLGMSIAPCAQAQPKHRPISVGYVGHYLIQPGAKVGTQFELGSASNAVQPCWVVSPQLGLYTRPGNETTVLVNAEVGYRRSKRDRPFYRGAGLGLGYLAKSEVLGRTVRLGDGGTAGTERELWHFVLPTLTYEWGWRVSPQRAWYIKHTLGRTLSPVRDGQMVMFVELGLTLWPAP
ncbi:MAG: hypothetical protein RhofKO_36120 [Rhodothermales bacterium]